MRPWLIIVLTAVVIAGLASAVASHEPFESKLVRLEAARALPSLELQQESAELNALFLSYAADQALWMSASLAILRHGDIARSTLVDYGLSPQFQDVLVRFGADAVLPISYFRDHDVTTLRAQHWIGERYQQVSRWWSDERSEEGDDTDVVAAMAELTPYRRGQMGIALLDANGHGLLNQFVMSDKGEVEWLQGERVVAGVGDFFTSGLRDLESQWRRGDAIGAADLGWAGVDLLVMASTVKVLRAGRAARTARVGSIEAQGARTGLRQGALATTGGRFATLPRIAKVAAVAGTAYIVIRHPSLVSALGANLSNWLGWPTWLGQFLIWLIVLLPVLIVTRFIYRWLLIPLLWLLMPLMRVCFRAVNRSFAKRTQEQPE
ncbi:hypothetical protein LCGC14_0055180 [marine sediment metagenome]|uniref:Uncharacterized protein n=1 Tax=marine sediment metagenome TaxID=412755 RepID=A0A0F9Y6J5_9ZZZZ|nr:hypothetical protein [Halomonas sp.]HDZ46137.1 hypothetical protein [Halomonas sp.]HEB05035.1 hypothetical protein [Halomonas sp.]